MATKSGISEARDESRARSAAGAASRGAASGASGQGGSAKKKDQLSLGALLGLDDIQSSPSKFGAGGTANQGAGAPADRPLKPVAPQLPQIVDVAPAEPQPDQDLTPLVDAPKRKPIRSALGSFAGSVGITGQAGVFIP